ncbi:class GN sortase [Erythrobacter sp. KY5]|uniref:class GN sortase n=1 Tax=Erythrobacter sp. KY5 TaxID=2011159 RepID=UPI0018F8AB9B|nr:class GN sortase [Erythrobacter sp. KY5]
MTRALPLLFVAVLLLSGAALVAKALYIPVKAEVAQVLLERAFEHSVASGAPVKPWSWADTAPVARVTLPRLGTSEIVLSGGSGEAMAFGPTAVLDNPRRGITVLAAHRDTHFEFVADVEPGDIVRLERIDGSVSIYRITHLETVRWDEFAYPVDAGDGLLALTTCWPFGTHTPGPLRRVAWAKRIDLRI